MKTKVISTTSPRDFIDLFNKYNKKISKWNNSNEIIDELVDILKNKTVEIHSDFVLCRIIDTLDEYNTDYYRAEELAEILTQRYHTVANHGEKYWIMELLPRFIGKLSYPLLIETVRACPDEEVRYKAMKQLALVSGQPFDRNLPKKFSYYRNDLFIRMDEIEQWIANDCPDGEGYPPPNLDPALENPVTELEQLTAKLNNKLKPQQDNKDFSSFTNFLVVADENKVNYLQNKYNLRGMYLEFLSRFSPCNVSLSKGFYEVMLYGVDILEEKQIGYSVSDKGEVFEDWPTDYLVIADRFADPYCIDLSKENSKVYIANHGEGNWKFRKAYNNFADFLNYLAK